MRQPRSITRPLGALKRNKPRTRRVTFGHRLEFLGYLAIRAIIRILPLKIASDLSAKLWQWIAPRLHRHERALKHLERAFPDLPEREREAIAHRMWGNLGRTMAESFVIDRIAADRAMIDFAIPDDVEALIVSRRPLVLASLHLGNWELAAVGASFRGLPMAGLYQRILNPLVDEAVTQSRLPYYKAGLHTKGHDTVKTLMRLIREGTSVGIVSDLRDNRGLPVPFFGHPAKSSPFPAMLSVLYDAPIIAARCVRKAPDRFLISVERIDATQGTTRDERINALTTSLHSVFERWIRENPDQWMWAHRRWD